MSILLSNGNNTEEEERQIFRECLEKCRDCECIATLRQYARKNETQFNQLDIQQNVFHAESLINLNDGLAYVTLMTSERGNFQIVRQMHDTVLKRGTERFLQKQDNDYFLIVDLMNKDDEMSIYYTFSLFQPQFFTVEGNSLRIALPMERMHFFKEQLDRDEIDYATMVAESEEETGSTAGNGYYTDTGAFLTGESFLK